MPAKRRKATKPAAGRKTRKGQPPWKPLIISLLIVIAIGLIYWFWPVITNWGITTWTNITNSVTTTWDNLLKLLGAGLALLAAAVVTLVCIIWLRLSLLHPKYWNRWLGGVSLAFAVWGLLAFFAPGSGIISQTTLGGIFGKGIITNSPIAGGLRLAGLIFLSILFLAPRWTWHAIVTIFQAIGKPSKLAGELLAEPGNFVPKPSLNLNREKLNLKRWKQQRKLYQLQAQDRQK